MDIELNRRITQIVRALHFSVTNRWTHIAKQHSLSSAQQYLLYVLYSAKEPLTVSEISHLGCWHISTVTRLLKRLLTENLISINKGKGRSKFVTLTEVGKHKLGQIAEDLRPLDNFPLDSTGIDDESLELFAQIGLQLLKNQRGTELTRWMQNSETKSIELLFSKPS